jgi:hypothetical protein
MAPVTVLVEPVSVHDAIEELLVARTGHGIDSILGTSVSYGARETFP